MHYSFAVAKRFKGQFAVVCAKSAVADTAERQVHIGKLEHRIIEDDSPGSEIFFKLTPQLFGTAKTINCQR